VYKIQYRQADKSGQSTYSTCPWSWNSHSRHQNGDWEYQLKKGEGNLPS